MLLLLNNSICDFTEQYQALYTVCFHVSKLYCNTFLVHGRGVKFNLL